MRVRFSSDYSGFKFSLLEISKRDVLPPSFEPLYLANLTFFLSSEVALSRIIPTFRYAPSKDEVVWRFGSLSSPAVKGSTELLSPELPFIVSENLRVTELC
jgi:hypothetical protein